MKQFTRLLFLILIAALTLATTMAPSLQAASAPAAPASNPIISLGQAANYAILGYNILLHNTDVWDGPVGVGYNDATGVGKMQVESPGVVHDAPVYKDPLATITGSTGPSNLMQGIIVQEMDQAFADAMTAYNQALALTPDLTINGSIGSSTTIDATHGGQYVIRITGDIKSQLVLNPYPGETTKFVVILEGTITLGGSDTVGAPAPAGAKDVLIVVEGTGSTLTSHINNRVYATMLAPYRQASFHGFNGSFIGGDLQAKFMSDCQIYLVSYTSYDFGDAPTAAQSGLAASYPTTLADDGARHEAVGPTLGAARDVETDGQPNTAADGDDVAGSPDDEDGVILPAFSQGQSVVATVTASAAAKLDAWIDWNRDGDWADAGEQVASNLALNSGPNLLNISVPADAAAGVSYARFRLSSAGSLNFTGAAADGEVEDYAVSIEAAGSIGDYVWNDANGNGLQEDDEDNNGVPDASESKQFGLENVVINLYRDNGDNICDASDAAPANFVATQTSASDGSYNFGSLPPDIYCVDVDESSMLGGYELMPGPQSGPEPHLVDLGPGEAYTAADFGYAGRGSISGIVFYDWDSDGQQGLGEDGLPDVAICLYEDSDNDGVIDPGSSPLACQDTGPFGDYLFTGYLPGDYLVVQTQPAGLQNTTPNSIDVALVVIGSSGAAPDNDFGEIVYSSLGDFIFLDPNGDGVQAPGETDGVPNIVITVKNLSTGAISITVSSSIGGYLVDNLLPGTYEVSAPGGVPGLVRTTASPRVITLGIDDHPTNVDFGYISPTAVQMASFTALYAEKGVLIQWSTLSEQAQTGFRVWRSFSADGVYKQVSPVLAAANSPTGSSYEWLDSSATPDGSYWYRIESLPDGELFGPVRVIPDPGTSANRIFIPIIVR